ncbi:9225_t:CDS:10, partial [Racocetra fulgida]
EEYTPGSKVKKPKKQVKPPVTDNVSDDDSSGFQGLIPKNAVLNISKLPYKTSSNGIIDYSSIKLKNHHASRPLWINPGNGHIILEAFSPFAEKAQDFLITISEPVSRPSLIHEYKMTPYSLYAAVSVGLETEAIIDTEIPDSVIEMIRECTISYGKVKLLLKQNRYFVESSHPEVLQMLLRDPAIAEARINNDESTQDTFITNKAPTGKDLVIPGKNEPTANADNKPKENNAQDDELLFNTVVAIDKEDEEDEEDEVHSFEIRSEKFENVKKRCNELNYPMLEEYDFRNDATLAPLEIDLKPITVIRPYQEKCLSKMFGNGYWSNIKESQISVFTSDQKEKFIGQSGIVISTYSMVANTRTRSYEASKMMDFITGREWGFILLDEVHVVPANMFLREDDKIQDLNFLIGPKLYEANWMDLASKGHIANVQCAEVWCDMTPEFYAEYLKASSRKRMLLYAMNPNKLQACQFLIQYHEERGDKVIVFSDNVYALEVGDTSIDLPEATCLIQISSHYGSRRQEAQRL